MIGDKYVGYSMDQIEFVNGLTTIDGEESTGTTDDTVSSQALAKRFLSVLMAVAFALLTRVDVCVFVTYLQRHTTSPTHGHIRALNTVVRWMKKTSTQVYLPLHGVLQEHRSAHGQRILQGVRQRQHTNGSCHQRSKLPTDGQRPDGPTLT